MTPTSADPHTELVSVLEDCRELIARLTAAPHRTVPAKYTPSVLSDLTTRINCILSEFQPPQATFGVQVIRRFVASVGATSATLACGHVEPLIGPPTATKVGDMMSCWDCSNAP